MAAEPVVTAFGDDDFERAFASLFSLAMGPALRILRSVPAAEDVAAEVLARVYADWPRLRVATWREAWTVRVATNLAIDQVRRAKRKHPAVALSDTGELEVRLDLATSVWYAQRSEVPMTCGSGWLRSRGADRTDRPARRADGHQDPVISRGQLHSAVRRRVKRACDRGSAPVDGGVEEMTHHPSVSSTLRAVASTSHPWRAGRRELGPVPGRDPGRL